MTDLEAMAREAANWNTSKPHSSQYYAILAALTEVRDAERERVAELLYEMQVSKTWMKGGSSEARAAS